MADGRPRDAAVVAAAFTALPVAAVALQGPEHLIVAANPAYETLIGRADVVGRTVRHVIPEAVSQQIVSMLDRVRDNGLGEQLVGWRAQLGEGTALREVYLDCLIVPWDWPDGRRRGVLVTAADVSDRVRAHHEEQTRARHAERRYAAAHDLTLELQRALLPAHLPVLPAVELSARYLVAALGQAAGGDWFDAVQLDHGRVGLVVGDVVGHGVAASAAMGQLRVVLRHALQSRHGELAAAVADLDRYIGDDPALRATTLCVAVLDPQDGALTYCTIGHPPPLLVNPTGAARYLTPTGPAHPGSGQPPTVGTDTVGPDDVLLLYSDGLIDRAGQRRRQTLETLATVAGDAAANRIMPLGASMSRTERVCEQTVEVLTRSGHHDDVTVLAARRRTPVGPLSIDVPAERAQLTVLRSRVAAWLGEFPATSGQSQALTLAVTEVGNNVVEYAHRRGDGRDETIAVTGELTAEGVVEIRIADGGLWPPATSTAGEGAGRGLWIAGSLVDELRVEHPADGGTVVVLRSRMRRLAHLGAATLGSRSEPGPGVTVRVMAGPPAVVVVTGAVDASTADTVAERLDSAGRGGMLPLTVDLTGVTVLSSAGVRALFTARDRHERHGTALDVLAEPDSSVADVLELSGLDAKAPAVGPSTVVGEH
ncbi:SpoIIE family protein phosphatase [Nakamurella flava]|nr:SpoIIE family protein phosphatase [Nakamurella flava]